jgi:ankyrin repeat protein
VYAKQVWDYTERNINLWREIHDFIGTNNLPQLMTLLSKHTINFNSFDCIDGDTILHSAAKSNNVRMIELVLQRLSPGIKAQMLKMKNKRGQVPSDLITSTWTPSTHSLFPLKFRQVVKAVLMLRAKRQDGTPYYPQTHFYKLPKDVLFIILQYAITS